MSMGLRSSRATPEPFPALSLPPCFRLDFDWKEAVYVACEVEKEEMREEGGGLGEKWMEKRRGKDF